MKKNAICKTTSQNFYQQFGVKNEKCKKANVTKIFFVAVLCVLLVFVVVLFSLLKAKNSKRVFLRKVYLLVVGKFDNVSNAKELADKIETAGGAGFVWVENEFWVVAFVYPSYEDAKKVQNQLGGDWRSTIEKKNFKKPKKSKLSKDQQLASDLLFKLADKFYGYALQIDQNTNKNAVVFKKLSEDRQNILFALKKLGDSEVDLVLAQRLELINEEIESFLKASYPKNLYSSGIKLLCVKAVFACAGVACELEKVY